MIRNGPFAIEEDNINRSIEESGFRADPEAKKFISIATGPMEKAKIEQPEESPKPKSKLQRIQVERNGPRDRSSGTLTLAPIITCAAVYFRTRLKH